MNDKLYQGEISIYRYAGGDNIIIEVEDVLSRTRSIRIEIPLSNFSAALVGLSGVECNFKVNSDFIGKKKETKVIDIDFDPDEFVWNMSYEKIQEIVAPYEVDGWNARYSDIKNYKRLSRNKKTISVTFFRWIKENESE